MNVLLINCDSGVSGDMMLGAFIDLGVPLDYLQEKLNRLKLGGYRLFAKDKEVDGTIAKDVDVILEHEEDLVTNPYSGDYRNFAQILEMINNSSLPNNVKVMSRRIFEIKAKAEAVVHGVPIDEVKFHEAGAVDSIVDIVGTAICCDYIQPEKIISKEVPTGSGEVKCACGILTVPVPAVRQILSDTKIPYYQSEIKQEILTPTGASIIAGLTDEFQWDSIDGEVLQRGYGTGKRDTGLAPLELTLCNIK
ncbi:uncharacterized protein (TIGR00299 family) protein [Clostridiales Family XIII bacterium PM5-7]